MDKRVQVECFDCRNTFYISNRPNRTGYYLFRCPICGRIRRTNKAGEERKTDIGLFMGFLVVAFGLLIADLGFSSSGGVFSLTLSLSTLFMLNVGFIISFVGAIWLLSGG